MFHMTVSDHNRACHKLKDISSAQNNHSWCSLLPSTQAKHHINIHIGLFCFPFPDIWQLRPYLVQPIMSTPGAQRCYGSPCSCPLRKCLLLSHQCGLLCKFSLLYLLNSHVHFWLITKLRIACLSDVASMGFIEHTSSSSIRPSASYQYTYRLHSSHFIPGVVSEGCKRSFQD
jgi:hypothetical protein